MPTPIVRAYLARVADVNAGERSLVAKINTSCIDRYRTVIDARGIELANYRSNPVVLFEHGRDPMRGSMPIGRNEWIRPAIGPDGPELLAKTFFYAKGKKGDEFTERLFECYRDGDMRAFSVNVVPDEQASSPPTYEELRQRPALKDCLQMYRKGDLAEYSTVAVGGNPEALTDDESRSVLRCVARGLVLPTELVARAKRTAEPTGRTIGRDGEAYLVIDVDGAELSRHATEAEATAALASHDATATTSAAPPPEPELPPLGGRSLADRHAELVAGLRGLFDPAKLKADLEMAADLRRGKV